MKKKLRLLLLFLLFLVPTIKAETLTESTNNYITQMNEMTINVKAKMNSLNSWMQDYKDEVVAVLDQNLMDSLLNEISSENYAGSIELLIDALTDANYLEAANKLDQIDLGNSIADYLELEENLLKFINDNSSSLNIIDGTEEGVDCLFNLYDAMNASYDELKTSITNNFEKLSTLLGSVFEKYLDKIKTISNQELAEIFAEYKDYLGFIDEMVTKYNQAFTKYEDVLKKVIGNEATLSNRLKDKVASDVKTLISKYEAKIKAPLNDFIEDRWSKLKADVAAVVSSDDTILNRNARLYSRMDKIEEINNDITKEVNATIANVNSSFIKNKMKSLLTKTNNELNDAIAYIEENLLIGDYDIKLIKNHDSSLTIDRARELIIVDKIFKVNDFQRQIILANEGFGILKYNFNNLANVATKSLVTVTENDEVMKKYTVVVKGDVDSNGRITVTDVLETAHAALKSRTFDEFEFIAADLDYSNRITVTDVLEIANRALAQGGSI